MRRDTSVISFAIMNLLSLTACAMFLCLAVKSATAKIDYNAIIDEAEHNLLKDWTKEDEVIIRLINRTKAIESSYGECEKRLNQYNDKIKAYDKEQKDVTAEVSQRAKKVAECSCSGGGVDRTLTVTIDDKFLLFLDGKEIKGLKNALQWPVADTVKLPSDTKVIAVKGANDFGDAGVLASTEDGYVLTNNSWKCSNKEAAGWKTEDFDDSSWHKAHVILPVKEKPVAGIHKDASWIWTKKYSYKDGDIIAFCRLKLQ